jgi:hypothetical protein
MCSTLICFLLFCIVHSFQSTIGFPDVRRCLNKKYSNIPIFRFTDDQYDPELAATIGVDFKVKVGTSLLYIRRF